MTDEGKAKIDWAPSYPWTKQERARQDKGPWLAYFPNRAEALKQLESVRYQFGTPPYKVFEACGCDICQSLTALDRDERAKKAASAVAVSSMPLALVHVLEEITQANMEGWQAKALYVVRDVYDAIAVLSQRDYPMVSVENFGGRLRLAVYGVPLIEEAFLAEPVVASKYPPTK